MIQIYAAGNTAFDKNGDCVLLPTEASTSAEINGSYSATLTHPIDAEGRYEYLTEGAVIKMPSYNGDQLFRVRVCSKTQTEIVCDMEPIFFDSAHDCFLTSVRPTNRNGQQALDVMCAPNAKYHGVSNITKQFTAYYEYKNLMEALTDEENGFLTRWGGEMEFDNFTVRVMTRLGADNGAELRYGKNIAEIQQTVDLTDVVTRIYPKAFNGRKKTGTAYVDSPLINSYPTVNAAEIVFENIVLEKDLTEDADLAGLTVCKNQAELNTALAVACRGQFDSGIDKPAVTIEIPNVVDLSKIEGYEGFGENLHLGDTVLLKHSVLGIDTSARVVALTYDSIRDRTLAVTIGSVAYNFMTVLSSTVNRVQNAITPAGAVKAETVTGIIDMKRASLYAQYDQAERQDVLGILFENNDATSELYGAMAIGTQGFLIADHKTADGAWDWRTFGTARGFIADMIIAGILSSRDGLSYWNLDDSAFRFYEADRDAYIEMDDGRMDFAHAGRRFGEIGRGITGDNEDVLVIEGADWDHRFTIASAYAAITSGNLRMGLYDSTGNLTFYGANDAVKFRAGSQLVANTDGTGSINTGGALSATSGAAMTVTSGGALTVNSSGSESHTASDHLAMFVGNDNLRIYNNSSFHYAEINSGANQFYINAAGAVYAHVGDGWLRLYNNSSNKYFQAVTGNAEINLNSLTGTNTINCNGDYVRQYNNSTNRYGVVRSADTWIRVDGKSDYIRLQCGNLQINGTNGYSGTVTAGTKKFTIQKGIITGVANA